MRTNVLAWLIALAVVDAVIPVPVVSLVLIWVVWRRPRWFSDLVRGVYGG